jgi:large conductance mechanosensitive channel
MLKDFKAFVMRGNILELAIAFVLGLAFVGVVTSFTNDILMAAIGAIVGKPNFADLTLKIGDGRIRYGAFLTVLVNFLIVAFALFLVKRAVDRFKSEPEATTRPCPYCRTDIAKDATRCPACTATLTAA